MGFIRSPYKITSIKPNKHTTAASVRLKHSKRSIAQGSEDQSFSLQQTTMDRTLPLTSNPHELKKLTVNVTRNARNASTTINKDVPNSRYGLQTHQIDDTSQTIDPTTDQSLIYRKGSLNLQAQKKAMALYKAPVIKAQYK